VCCDGACGATCKACSAAKKGSGVDGACGTIKVGADPDSECAGADTCSGNGACQCSNGVKDNGEADVDCGGVCAKCAQGKACGAAGDCSSGFCVDGVCCSSVCTATCMACSAALTGQASGTCANIPVQGVDTYPANTCVAPSFCSGTGSCGVCVPGALRCSGNVAQACNYTGAWVAQQTCGGGNVCRAGACVAQPSCAGLAATCGSGANQSCCLTKQVTGGAFYMGQPQGGANLGPNDDYTGYYKDNTEGPEHNASVNTFKLDAFETTVGRFRKFVAAYPWTPGAGEGAVLELGGVGWQAAWNNRLQASQAALTARLKSCQGATWTDAVGGNENQPINCVDYYTAYAFCIWDGGRLPTEAEWEYTSTAGLADRVMPWGAGIPAPDCTYSNSWNSCQGGAGVPHNVGLATNGVSAYGHYDMVGNVWEIAYDQKVAYSGFDCALGSCIAAPPASNVAFSAVLKGSAYDNETVEGRSARRNAVTSTSVFANVGFRCMHFN
jgi:formylglycine-generating enzyme required for sulfatase activity